MSQETNWGGQQSELSRGIGKVWEPNTGNNAASNSQVVSDLTPSAKEWSPVLTPQQQQQQQAAPNVIKEFVPGKGLQQSFVSPAAAQGGLEAYQNYGEGFAQSGHAVAGAPGGAGMPYGSHQIHDPASHAGQEAMAQQFMSAAEAEAYARHGGIPPDPSLVDTPPLVAQACQLVPPRRTLESILLPDNLRSYFAKQAQLRMECAPPNDPRLKEVPRRFHSILPLDDPSIPRGTAGSSGYPSSLYKVVNARDGFVYVLRRIDNIRVSHELCGSVLDMWSHIRHANIVPLRDAFVHQRALYLVHDYVPGAESLSQYVSQQQGRAVPERVIWSVCTQILTAIRQVHDANACCRGVIPQRVLLSGRHKARLSSAGMMHLLESRTSKSIQELQQEDLIGLAQVILCLACMNIHAMNDTHASLEFVRNRYSADLYRLVMQPFSGKCNVYDLLVLASQGLLSEIDTLYSHADALEEHLAMQYDNDRMTRLMMKLGVITERPGANGKSASDSWSETGDRYIVKLFRDYVFHQTNDAGQPWLDMGHIISCLNKLDMGSNEQLLLTGRDGRSFLVVTYRDVRRCLEEAFQELINQATAPSRGHMGRVVM